MSKTETWGIILAIAGLVVPLALYLIDKAEKGTPAITIALLILLAALWIGAVLTISNLHEAVSRISNSTTVAPEPTREIQQAEYVN